MALSSTHSVPHAHHRYSRLPAHSVKVNPGAGTYRSLESNPFKLWKKSCVKVELLSSASHRLAKKLSDKEAYLISVDQRADGQGPCYLRLLRAGEPQKPIFACMDDVKSLQSGGREIFHHATGWLEG